MGILCPIILPTTCVVSLGNTKFAQRRAVGSTLGEHILDIAVAQSEAEIEPDGLLDDDARKPVAVVGELVQKRTLYGSPVPNQRVTVTVPATCLAARWPGR